LGDEEFGEGLKREYEEDAPKKKSELRIAAEKLTSAKDWQTFSAS